MKKQIMAFVIAIVMMSPLMVQANQHMAGAGKGKMTIYGRVHVSVDKLSDTEWQLNAARSKANRIGLKGSKPAHLFGMSGIKAIYKLEAGYNLRTGNNNPAKGSVSGFTELRDTWVGLSSKTVGTFRAGAINSSYKMSGKAVDPFFTTSIEGRGGLGSMSKLHGGNGDTGREGRATNNLRYDSPSFSGAKIAISHTLSKDRENATSFGVHYKNGPVLAFVDYVNAPGVKIKTGGTGGNALKIGGKWSKEGVSIGGQYEIDGGLMSQTKDGEANQLFLSAAYKMGATTFGLTFGLRDESKDEAVTERTSWALGVKQKVGKKVLAYVGYGAIDDDAVEKNDNVVTAGMAMNF